MIKLLLQHPFKRRMCSARIYGEWYILNGIMVYIEVFILLQLIAQAPLWCSAGNLPGVGGGGGLQSTR